MKDIHGLLAEHSFFQGLLVAHLDLIAGCGRNMHFKSGDTVIKEGAQADYFYVLRHGRVALEIEGAQRGVIRIQTLEQGDILGWSWLIPPHQWSFTAKAVEATSVIALDGKCLREKCQHDHELGYELLIRFAPVLAKRLEATRMQLLDVYGDH